MNSYEFSLISSIRSPAFSIASPVGALLRRSPDARGPQFSVGDDRLLGLPLADEEPAARLAKSFRSRATETMVRVLAETAAAL
jgi:hypothetical protein